MKQFFLILFLCVFLTGCKTAPTPAAETTSSPQSTEPSTVPTTFSAHSEFYLPGISLEDVHRYFTEVCLNAEFINSGDPSVIQKWTQPIAMAVLGQPTVEDLRTLSAFTEWLNTIDGFPGITLTEDPNLANLRFHFCSHEELINLMGSQFSGMDGAVTFWYQDNAIYDAIICCRTDLDQTVRNSVILEELYNGLGPVQDTSLRPDSIIYAEYSEPQALTDVDELILKLLYHPDILCGMSAAECEAVIRRLYE